MSLSTLSTPFGEKDFEQLAAALDAVPATRRELFLAKLVILLAANCGGSEGLGSYIDRAKVNLAS